MGVKQSKICTNKEIYTEKQLFPIIDLFFSNDIINYTCITNIILEYIFDYELNRIKLTSIMQIEAQVFSGLVNEWTTVSDCVNFESKNFLTVIFNHNDMQVAYNNRIEKHNIKKIDYLNDKLVVLSSHGLMMCNPIKTNITWFQIIDNNIVYSFTSSGKFAFVQDKNRLLLYKL